MAIFIISLLLYVFLFLLKLILAQLSYECFAKLLYTLLTKQSGTSSDSFSYTRSYNTLK